MTSKEYLKENFKNRYKALISIQKYLQNWQSNSSLQFSNKEQDMLKRFINTIERAKSKLLSEYTMLFNEVL